VLGSLHHPCSQREGPGSCPRLSRGRPLPFPTLRMASARAPPSPSAPPPPCPRRRARIAPLDAARSPSLRCLPRSLEGTFWTGARRGAHRRAASQQASPRRRRGVRSVSAMRARHRRHHHLHPRLRRPIRTLTGCACSLTVREDLLAQTCYICLRYPEAPALSQRQ